MNEQIGKLEFLYNISEAFKETEAIPFKKGELLTREGTIEKNLFYIEDGAVKIYYQSELNEHIIRLGYSGSILNSLTSFLTQSPSELIIEVIRETKVKILKRSQVMNIIKNSTGYEIFLEKLITEQLEREIDLLQDSPNKRLERVLKRSPHLFQHIPLKYIATYLRMSPETLSRIRNS